MTMNSDEIRARFTRNAEEFDALMVEMLAQNEQLQADNRRLIDENAALHEVYDHARGMCFGVDWNKGTAASCHRNALIEAVNRIEKLPKLRSTTTGQERNDGGR